MRRRSEPAAAFAVAALAMLAIGCHTAPAGLKDEPDVAKDSVAKLARETLAIKLGVPQERITVVSVAAVEWRDSSVGCPQPGMSYLTVITPGHKVMLQVDGQTYAVHEAKGRALVCKRPTRLRTQESAQGLQSTRSQ